jgi:hypothetical protein
MEKTKHEKHKKPYTKPEAIRFPLRPEEAVLGFCKTTSHGAIGGHCGNATGGCPSAGS